MPVSPYNADSIPASTPLVAVLHVRHQRAGAASPAGVLPLFTRLLMSRPAPAQPCSPECRPADDLHRHSAQQLVNIKRLFSLAQFLDVIC